ncbi:MAG: ferrous iron transport protein B [Muribaculaceae bacterium]|nr:ferrous iron transport protein B [Muribaculaceae bacterium]
MTLDELKTGQSAIIVKIHGYGAFRKRVIEMGFTKGRKITAVLSAPLRDPVKYTLMGYEVSLRRSEAQLIEIVPIATASAQEIIGSGEAKATVEQGAMQEYEGRSHTINVALIGNPNCGKTSLFNLAAGASEHVGNYSGVTVDSKAGRCTYRNYNFNIVDLPGTYSLSTYSPEELYVRRYLKNERPDVIINVVDSSNLERNLYLTTELIDMDRPMIIALNMFDELQRSNVKLDYETLGAMIGVPIVPTVSRTGKGLDALLDTVISTYEQNHTAVRHVHVKLSGDLEKSVARLNEVIKSDDGVDKHFSHRYLAIKMLEKDREVEQMLSGNSCYQRLKEVRDHELKRLETLHEDDVAAMIASEKYGFIAGALAETMDRRNFNQRVTTQVIDSLVTNRYVGFPLFIFLMFLMFWTTFFLGQYPQEWIEAGVTALGDLMRHILPEGALRDLVADGIIGGVGGVIVFLPNILILYFFISLMEDTGYMSRAAFIMDSLMHKIGLHGKSFIPLVMGFGCNVPAIIASRSIESRSSRIITILINPFMSCSARLPVYVLMIGTFFSSYAALVFIGVYLLGIVMAVVTARLLRQLWFKKDETPFVMELPPYRMPTMKSTLTHMWAKGYEYLKKMGGIILVGSIVVWALNYFPLKHRLTDEERVEHVAVENNSIDDRDSYLEMIGKAINPVMEPLGFTWRATVAAIAGLPAKEIVVSTLSVLYTGQEDEEITETLEHRLTTPSPVTGKPDFTPASALAFIVFILLYSPCIATVTAIVRETGSWRYGAFSVAYNTVAAWVVAWCVYHIALLF